MWPHYFPVCRRPRACFVSGLRARRVPPTSCRERPVIRDLRAGRVAKTLRFLTVAQFLPAVTPPSTSQIAPVTHEDSSENKNRMTEAISAGWPIRAIHVQLHPDKYARPATYLHQQSERRQRASLSSHLQPLPAQSRNASESCSRG